MRLTILLCIAFIVTVYVSQAEGRHWPIPTTISTAKLCLAVAASTVTLVILLFLNARCPRCRRVLMRFTELRRCPRAALRSGLNWDRPQMIHYRKRS